MSTTASEVSTAAAAEAVIRPAQPPKDLPKTAGAAITTFLSNTSPQILVLALVWDAGWRVAMGGWRLLDLWVTLALLAYWPINEWLIHVFILHNPPRAIGGWRFDYLVAKSHREHHGDPWNLKLVFIPLHIFPLSLPALVIGAFWLAPDYRIAMTFLTAYAALSLHYEWCHYLAHIGWHPPIGYYERRVREHRLHHFRNERYWWGVSMGSGDRLFRTAKPAEQVERSATVGIVHS